MLLRKQIDCALIQFIERMYILTEMLDELYICPLLSKLFGIFYFVSCEPARYGLGMQQS